MRKVSSSRTGQITVVNSSPLAAWTVISECCQASLAASTALASDTRSASRTDSAARPALSRPLRTRGSGKSALAGSRAARRSRPVVLAQARAKRWRRARDPPARLGPKAPRWQRSCPPSARRSRNGLGSAGRGRLGPTSPAHRRPKASSRQHGMGTRSTVLSPSPGQHVDHAQEVGVALGIVDQPEIGHQSLTSALEKAHAPMI